MAHFFSYEFSLYFHASFYILLSCWLKYEYLPFSSILFYSFLPSRQLDIEVETETQTPNPAISDFTNQ